MKLKKILEKEKEKKQDELIVREIMAARQTNAIEKDYDPDDEQTLDRSSHRSSVRFFENMDNDENTHNARLTSADLDDTKMRTIIE